MPLTGIQSSAVTTPGTPVSGSDKLYTIKAGGWVYFTFDAIKTWILSTFLSFADTPDTYAAQAGKIVRVKSAEDGLEFVTNSFLALADTPSAYTGQGTKFVRVNAGATALEFVDSPSGGSGTAFSNYSPLAGINIEGTTGITATKASGVITLTIPLNGVLKSGEVDFSLSDATYTNGILSGGLKLKIVNTANGSKPVTVRPIIMARTSAGAILAANPLQYNTPINLSLQSDEYSAGVTSWMWDQVAANAPAGGFIQF